MNDRRRNKVWDSPLCFPSCIYCSLVVLVLAISSGLVSWQGAVRRFMTGDAPSLLHGRMEISVSKLQNPLRHWPPWPLKNVRIRSFEVRCAYQSICT